MDAGKMLDMMTETATRYRIRPTVLNSRTYFMLSYLVGGVWHVYPVPFVDRSIATRTGKLLVAEGRLINVSA